MKIKSKKIIKYNGMVNDLSVEKTSSYNVEGLGVHNSSAGSLVCYLSGITEINPIEHDLMFERFINTSRFYKEHVNFEEFEYLNNYRGL